MFLYTVAFNQEYRQNRPYTSIDRYTVGNRTDVTDIEVELANLDFAEDDGRQSVLEFEKTPNDEEKDAERSVAVGSARLQLSFEELKETLLGSVRL